MLHTLHILAVKPNQTHLLSLREMRTYFYRSFGNPSALAFEPVIPISVCTIEAGSVSAAKGDTPFKKELFIGFSRSGKTANGPPVLSFSSLERFRDTYYYPLTSTRIWETLNDVLEEEHGAVDPPAHPVHPAPLALPVLPIPPFPGIFVAAAEEGAAGGHGAKIAQGKLARGELNNSGSEFGKTAFAPEPWRNYKLALFELEWRPGNNEKWWDGCSWREVWELTLGGFS